MKPLLKACSLGVLFSLLTVAAVGDLTRPGANIVGKFFVSAVKGDVTVINDGRIYSLKKGDTYTARGTIIETSAGSHATIVFSNGTGVYADEKTYFEIEKFDQEFFAPNNNLRVEPSNSDTVVRLTTGRVVISTPRLLSGTTMFYQTPHAGIYIRGEKILIEVNEKQTHVAMIAGNATVDPRDADGNFVSLGKRLVTGQEAFVKYTVAAHTVTDNEFAAGGKPATPSPAGAPAKPGAKPAASTAAAALGTGSGSGNTATAVTMDTEAVVVKLSGTARAKLAGTTKDFSLGTGTKLPKGALIETDKQTDLFLQAFEGVVADLRPNTTVQIATLSVTSVGGTVKKQTALLDLKSGTIISTLDPAAHEINDYGVRTPKGIAKASGTSFAVSIDDNGFSVATTADSVSFVTPAGTAYTINAGQVTITPPGGVAQPPVSLASAVAANPAFATDVQAALTAVTTVIQGNLGSLSPESAVNLVTKVATTVAEALPEQAAAIASQAIIAVTTPSSSTSSNVAAAAAAVTSALVAAVPAQATQIATAATTAAPTQAVNIAAAAAKQAPAQAAQIASAVTQVYLQTSVQGQLSPANVQQAAAIAAGVTSSAPNQAAPVAAAVMQAVALANPQATPQSNIQSAATIAAAVTTAAPSQAVPVAATMMKTLSQTASMVDATPQVVAQAAATLATSVTAVVPPQAQPVATAVMQLVVQAYPNFTPDATLDVAGLVTAAVTQAAPSQGDAIASGVAGASNQPLASVQSASQSAGPQVGDVMSQAGTAEQSGSQAAQTGSEGSQFANNNNGGNSSNDQGSNSENGGSSSGQGNNSSSSVAQNSNNGNGAGGSGEGNGTGNGGNSGNEAGGNGNGGAGSNGGGGGGGGSTTPGATSIFITQFDPSDVADITLDLQAAQSAQTGVQFDTQPNGGGGTTVVPVETTPSKPPPDFVTSPANG